MNPLDLMGPEFLTFYLIAAFMALGIAVAMRWILRWPADDSDAPPHLSNCEVAYLADGRKLAINAALARLVHDNCLTLDRVWGTLTIAGPLRPDTEPLEQALYHKVSVRGVRFLAEMYDNMASETDAIHSRLERNGLLLSAWQARVVRFGPAYLIAMVLWLGVAKLVVGIERDKPVGFLIALLVVLGVAMIGFTWKPFRTRRGDRLLAELRQEHAALQTAAQVTPGAMLASDLSLALGLFGVGILTHYTLSGLRQGMATNQSNDWAGGGGGGFGGGGGCGGGGGGGGGGGCGGGGCGGCGGG